MACEPLATVDQYAAAYPDQELDSATIQAALDSAALVLPPLLSNAQLSRCTFVLRPYQVSGARCWPQVDERFRMSHVAGYMEDIPMPMKVTEVLGVSVGGSALVAGTDYRAWFNGATWMVERLAGSWPARGNTGAASDLQVTVATGVAPDMLIRRAALQIANDLISSGVVDECGQDPHVISRTTQGVTMQYQPDEGADERMGAVNRLMARHEAAGARRAEIYTPAVGGWEFGEESAADEPWTA